jgi:hypothetical protein
MGKVRLGLIRFN